MTTIEAEEFKIDGALWEKEKQKERHRKRIKRTATSKIRQENRLRAISYSKIYNWDNLDIKDKKYKAIRDGLRNQYDSRGVKDLLHIKLRKPVRTLEDTDEQNVIILDEDARYSVGQRGKAKLIDGLWTFWDY